MSRQLLLRSNAFYGDTDIELSLPEEWDVEVCAMAGHDAPALSDERMREAIQHPIASPRLGELAKGAARVCILFDDITKPTPTQRILPFVLEELHGAGVGVSQIRLICAAGSHRPPTTPELEAKLGRDVLETYPVYAHTPWENLLYMGTTSRGTPISVNREFASCDLRLGIGGLLPHGNANFGGGGKMAVPGVCGMETIGSLHRIADAQFRANLEEGALLAGLHFKIDAVYNSRRQVAGLFAGDFVAEHRQASKLARQLYATTPATDADIVITNSYPTESQALRCQWCVEESLNEGGDAVVIRQSRQGEILHQLSSRLGSDYGGRFWDPVLRYEGLLKAGRVFLVTPLLSGYDRLEIIPPNTLMPYHGWDEVLSCLQETHGPGTRVAVYPCAPIQMAAMPGTLP